MSHWLLIRGTHSWGVWLNFMVKPISSVPHNTGCHLSVWKEGYLHYELVHFLHVSTSLLPDPYRLCYQILMLHLIKTFQSISLCPGDAIWHEWSWSSLVQYWIVACSAPSHCMSQLWIFLNWTLNNKLKWTWIYFQDNLSVNVACKITFSSALDVSKIHEWSLRTTDSTWIM